MYHLNGKIVTMLPADNGCMVIICEKPDGGHAAFVIDNPTLESVNHSSETLDHLTCEGINVKMMVNMECTLIIKGSNFKVLFGENLDEEFDPLNRASLAELISKIDHRLAAGGMEG
jgi:hypothetical protein